MLNLLLRIALCVCVGLSVNGQAQIVKWTDSNGKVHFGDTVPAEYKDTAEEVALSSANIIANDNSSSLPQPEPLENTDTRIVNRQSSTSVAEEEAECQKDYGMPCDAVENWEATARQNCLQNRGGDNCNDSEYLASKYKPRTLAQKRLQATRNACRRRETCGQNTIILRE